VSISLASFPQAGGAADRHANVFPLLQSVVTAARELRADNKLDPKRSYPSTLILHGVELADQDLNVIQALAKLTIAKPKSSADAGRLSRSTPEFDLWIDAEIATTNGAGPTESKARLEKENSDLRKLIDSSRRQLENEEFLKKAPEKVILSMRTKLGEYESQLKKNQDLLGGINESRA
jgi:valyl-tRNA synthetase